MIGAAVILGVGTLLSWLAFLNWRHRSEEKISLLEAAILKTTGVEPLPLTRFDRALQWFHIVMMSVFGPFLALAGLAGLLIEFGVIR